MNNITRKQFEETLQELEVLGILTIMDKNDESITVKAEVNINRSDMRPYQSYWYPDIINAEFIKKEILVYDNTVSEFINIDKLCEFIANEIDPSILMACQFIGLVWKSPEHNKLSILDFYGFKSKNYLQCRIDQAVVIDVKDMVEDWGRIPKGVQNFNESLITSLRYQLNDIANISLLSRFFQDKSHRCYPRSFIENQKWAADIAKKYNITKEGTQDNMLMCAFF